MAGCSLEESTINHQPQNSQTASSEKNPYLSVVVPAYNEEARLLSTLHQITDYLNQQSYAVELLVVDDGSSDRTVEQAEAVAAECDYVRVIKNDHRGKAFTVRTGILASQGTYILFSDADLAVPIEELDKLLPFLEGGYDVVIASREGQGAEREGEPAYRHLMGRVFNMIIRTITLGNFQDTQCGFKAFRKAVGHDLFNRVQLYGDNAQVLTEAAVTAFDVEILFLAVKLGYKVKEVPVLWIYGTETKVNPLKDSWRNLKDIVRVRLYDLAGRYS